MPSYAPGTPVMSNGSRRPHRLWAGKTTRRKRCAVGLAGWRRDDVSIHRMAPGFPGAIRWIETSSRLQPASPTAHLFLRVVFPAHSRWGLREPLLITGVPGAYDGINVVHYENGQGRFVLD